ncbi:MAG TPA: transposase [Solirubrobacteraceae bacterium]
MPPALVDWLPDEHFVWTVIGAVEQMDLAAFYGAYRANGQGRAAYDPQMLLGLLLYAYATGVSSSRQIERCCEVDVAFKVIAAMQIPDHSTIAEFRRRHQDAIGEVFVQILALCAEAGLVRVGVIAIDGTKIAANASRDCGRSYVSIVEELLADAEQADRDEDERHGDDRGDEPPAGLRSRDERRHALAEAKARLETQRTEQLTTGIAAEFDAGIELDVEQLRSRREGRRSWQREASHQLDAHRERQADPIPRGRRERLEDAKRRLEQELAVDTAANQAYETFHVSGRDTLGRRMGKHPKPHTPSVLPEGMVNLTDPDSRLIHDKRLTKLQGYNAQAAVSCDGQIILAAEISTRSPDFGHLAPVFDAAVRDLALAGVNERPQTVLADTGYWHSEQTDEIVAAGTQVLIPPQSRTRETPRPGWDTGRYAFMRAVLDSPAGSALYHQRAQSIEPTFGQIKHNRGFRQFRRRGRAAARAEWRLITSTHNLLKLHQHWIAPATA